MIPAYYHAPTNEGSDEDARSRRTVRIDVQLRVAGATGPAGSSLASDPAHHGSRVAAALAAIRHAVYQFRPPVDSARATVARVAAASAVHDSQRAAADGAAGLQPAVSLVRGVRH